jgi:uncharacterized protein (TIGR00299 family) protein
MSDDRCEILFVESVAGIAGDMFASACVDAGLISAGELEAVPELLGFTGVSVCFKKTTRANLAATHLEVALDDDCWVRFLESRPGISSILTPHPSGDEANDQGNEQAHRKLSLTSHVSVAGIDAILEASELNPESVACAKAIFHTLADAEARAHGISREQVHFHEVGRIDSIIDAAMAGMVITRLAPVRVFASNVKLGRGIIHIAHGQYPVPPPASAILSEGFPIDPVPEAIERENVELSTPTGLAILNVLQPEFIKGWPAGRVITHGYGAGAMDLKTVPNVTRIVSLQSAEEKTQRSSHFVHSEIVEIACNLDDQSPERTAWLHQEALNQGAVDVWVTPVVGKKNRPAQVFSMLVAPEREKKLITWMLRHSSTFGLRTQRWNKVQLERRMETRETPHGPLRYKIGMTTDGEIIKEKPEFDDLAEIWKKDPDFRPD